MKSSDKACVFFHSPGRKAGDRRQSCARFPLNPRPSGRRDHGRNARAFMAVDMLFGIIIIGGIAIALAATVRRERSAEEAMADSRSALHLAEHALLNLQHGQPMPAPAPAQHLTIHRSVDGTAPAGFIWAKVDASVNGHRQSLLGVVPAESIAPGTKS